MEFDRSTVWETKIFIFCSSINLGGSIALALQSHLSLFVVLHTNKNYNYLFCLGLFHAKAAFIIKTGIKYIPLSIKEM